LLVSLCLHYFTNLQISSPALIRAYMSSDMAGFWAARGRPKRELTAQECLDLEPTLAALGDANRDLVGGVLCQEGNAENHYNLPAMHVRRKYLIIKNFWNYSVQTPIWKRPWGIGTK
jgi:hypothetical protein